MKLSAVPAVIATIACAGLLAGCGGGGASTAPGVSTSGGVTHVTLDAGNDIMFTPSHVTVPPGPVQVTMIVSGNVPHEIEFPTLNIHSPLVTPGHSTTVHFTAVAGKTYHFDCDIHLADGMVGTVTVTS